MSKPTAPNHAPAPPLSEAAAEKPGPAEPAEKANREAAPEIPPKRKRGRPRSTPTYWDYLMGQVGEEAVLTRRSHVKHYYRQRAFEVLDGAGDGRDYGYLISGNFKNDILAELGRFHRADLLELAAVICRGRMKTKAVVAMLRGLRSGLDGPRVGSVEQLAKEIIGKINDYRSRYPVTSHEQVMDALEIATDTIGRQGGGAGMEAA